LLGGNKYTAGSAPPETLEFITVLRTGEALQDGRGASAAEIVKVKDNNENVNSRAVDTKADRSSGYGISRNARNREAIALTGMAGNIADHWQRDFFTD